MQKEFSEQSKMAELGNGETKGQTFAKSPGSRSRMRKCWKLIRARRRSAAKTT